MAGDVPVALSADDVLRLNVWELPSPLRALTEAPAFVRGLLALIGAWLLRGVLGEIADGRPFASGVARRITGLVGVAVAAAFVPASAQTVASAVVLEHAGLADAPGIGPPALVVDLGACLLAAVLVVVAAVVRHGAELSRDTEGLV